MGSARPRNSTRLRPALPDLHAILGRLARTRAFFTVAIRSLKADDSQECGEEAEVLEEALAALNGIYDELDTADLALGAVFQKLGVPYRHRAEGDGMSIQGHPDGSQSPGLGNRHHRAERNPARRVPTNAQVHRRAVPQRAADEIEP